MEATAMHRNSPEHGSLRNVSQTNTAMLVWHALHGNKPDVFFDEKAVTDWLSQGQPLIAVVETEQLAERLRLIHTIQGHCAESGGFLDFTISRKGIPGFFSRFTRGRSIIVVRAEKPRPTAGLQGDISAMDKNSKALHTARRSSFTPGLGEVGDDLDQMTRLKIELANAHRRLTKQHAELLKVNTEKSHILGMAAHELRNPISGILNASEYLLEDAARLLHDNDMTLLEAIRSSCRFMLQLINNLLEISAIESGKLRLHRKPTDILSLIEQNLSLNRPLAERRQIGINVIANGALPLISIDSHKIYQVVDNLVTNAIKFSSPGTKIEIRIRAEREFAVIDVQDQGPGIPANERRAVFKLFQTARGRDTSSGAGTGLGLAIAKSIVEAHGGRLMLDSRIGKGSTFTVTLPVAAHVHAVLTRGSRASRSVRKVVASATAS